MDIDSTDYRENRAFLSLGQARTIAEIAPEGALDVVLRNHEEGHTVAQFYGESIFGSYPLGGPIDLDYEGVVVEGHTDLANAA